MSDELFMQRALFLAELSKGNVMPNPMVGAVIVHNGNIIGEGRHEKYGEPHAEVNAVNSVVDKSLLTESTIYVTLEPCAHFGKTPPCAELIVKCGFKKVVIAQLDPHEKVAGKGVEIIRNAGIRVEIGILEQEARFLNRRFNTFHEKSRPYIVLKWAETQDGFMGRDEIDKGKESWMTSESSKKIVHEMRIEEGGILVGTNTAELDNPELTVRLVQGRNPVRIVLDKNKRLNTDLKVFNSAARTIHVTEELISNWDELWPELFSYLHQQGIQSVLIEGGSKVLDDIISDGLWDEAYKFVAPVNWNRGVRAPKEIDEWELINEHLQGDLLFRAIK